MASILIILYIGITLSTFKTTPFILPFQESLGLGLCAFTAEGAGSIPGQGTKIPQDARHGQKKISKVKTVTITATTKPKIVPELIISLGLPAEANYFEV